MNTLKTKLFARIDEMGKNEQKKLLNLIESSRTQPIIDSLKSELTSPDQIEKTKDDLVFLVFSALENNVPRETIFDGSYWLWMALKEMKRE